MIMVPIISRVRVLNFIMMRPDLALWYLTNPSGLHALPLNACPLSGSGGLSPTKADEQLATRISVTPPVSHHKQNHPIDI